MPKINHLQPNQSHSNHPSQVRIRLKIPRYYEHNSEISDFASLWLKGTTAAIDGALKYLSELDIEVWTDWKEKYQSEHNHPSQVRIRIKIPSKYHHEPVISYLASQHNLDVNILGAMLGTNAVGDGWFDLLLRGTSQGIDNALIYLSDLDIEIWHQADREIDDW